jgi:hypothetical protein
MLTDVQLKSMAEKMRIPLETVCFKNDLPPLKYNRSYIVNMQDELSEEGAENPGSHWVAFQIEKSGNDIRPMYVDSFGIGPPTELSDAVFKFCGKKLPYSSKNIQSLMADCCGYYALAWLHFINASQYRRGHIYTDTEGWLDMFHDLNVDHDFKRNEFILKHFFRSDNPAERLPVSLTDTITAFEE